MIAIGDIFVDKSRIWSSVGNLCDPTSHMQQYPLASLLSLINPKSNLDAWVPSEVICDLMKCNAQREARDARVIHANNSLSKQVSSQYHVDTKRRNADTSQSEKVLCDWIVRSACSEALRRVRPPAEAAAPRLPAASRCAAVRARARSEPSTWSSRREYARRRTPSRYTSGGAPWSVSPRRLRG